MTEVAKAYGSALYLLARDEGLTDALKEEYKVVCTSFAQEKGIYKVLDAPEIPMEERLSVVDAILKGRVHPYLLSFVKILTERHDISFLADCFTQFVHLYNEDHGILPVTAVTGMPMSDAQKQRLASRLSEITKKQIELTCRTDPACMAGVRLEMEDKLIDGSVQSRLNKLRAQMMNVVA